MGGRIRCEYSSEFDHISHRLPKNVVNAFRNRFLHDSEIVSIDISNRVRNKRIEKIVQVKITNESYSGIFSHLDVFELKLDYTIHGYYVRYGHLCEYLYGEILLEGDMWIHNFTCSDSTEVMIKCKKIIWEDVSVKVCPEVKVSNEE